ncbi:hypothetical protein ACFQ0D_03280 [Micromonospora zhanjiangensis]
MRLTGFVRTGRVLAPLLAGLLVIGVLNGGGRSQAAEAYAVSSVVLFPVLAWQAKLLLDIEPDVQRRLAVVTVGRRREALAGLLAATVVGLVPVLLGLVDVLIWEGLLSNLVTGTRVLSIQHYVIAIADKIASTPLLGTTVSFGVSVAMCAVITVGFTALAVDRLRSFSVAGETS